MSKNKDADATPAADKPAPRTDIGRSVLPPSSMDKPAAPTAPAAPTGPAAKRLTRADMEGVIASGGSVTLGGRLYASLADLPTQDQLDEYHKATDEHAAKANVAPALPAAPIAEPQK